MDLSVVTDYRGYAADLVEFYEACGFEKQDAVSDMASMRYEN